MHIDSEHARLLSDGEITKGNCTVIDTVYIESNKFMRALENFKTIFAQIVLQCSTLLHYLLSRKSVPDFFLVLSCMGSSQAREIFLFVVNLESQFGIPSRECMNNL